MRALCMRTLRGASLVIRAEHPEVAYMNRVMTSLREQYGDTPREVLVDQQPHAEGLSGLFPSATMPTIVATGMRVPRMHGTPAIAR